MKEYEIEDGIRPANISDGLTSEVEVGSNYQNLRIRKRSSELKKLACMSEFWQNGNAHEETWKGENDSHLICTHME